MIKIYTLLFGLLFLIYESKAQCWPTGFTHDTRPETMWLSCESSASPNPDRPEGLWLQFDFGQPYALSTTTIWNFNEPTYLALGVTELEIDYSTDGINWVSWGSFGLSLAPGTTDYEGENGPDLSGVTARYVLLTAPNENDGIGCAGLSEVRFNIDQMVSVQDLAVSDLLDVYPNPSDGWVNFRLPDDVQLEAISLYDQRGRLITNRASSGQFDRIDLSIYPSGVYLLVVTDANGKLHRKRITVV